MKAITYHRYGSPDVLEYGDVETPVPADDEVLVRVRAASVNPADWHYVRGTPALLLRPKSGMRKPKDSQLGADVAGVVEAAGTSVTLFRPGDAVFGLGHGSFAEYVCVKESRLVPKPDNVTFEQAAAVPLAALTALQGLRKGEIQAGQKVLVNGAAGGVGTFAVQLARSFGAEVTGVCGARNVELVRSLGANDVIDYSREDFTRSGRRWDLFVDIMGNHSLSGCRRVLTPSGTYVVVGAPTGRWLAPLPRLLRTMLLSRFVSQKLVPLLASAKQEDLVVLSELLANGKLMPVIDRSYPLHQVAEAIRYLETGHVRGKVVITIGSPASSAS